MALPSLQQSAESDGGFSLSTRTEGIPAGCGGLQHHATMCRSGTAISAAFPAIRDGGLTSCKALAVRLGNLVGLLCLSSVTLISCGGAPVHSHGLTIPTTKPASSTSAQPPSLTSTTVPVMTTTTTTPVVTTTTTPVVTQPVPEGSVSFDNVQAQTFSLNDGCNDVSFGIDNESNTTVASASVMFTMTKYSGDGSYAGPGPTQGPYGATVYVLPYTQRQLSVQVCPPVSLLLGDGEYFQVTGVNGTYSWAT